MLADRGVEVDHVTLYRWVQRFAPVLEQRLRRHLRRHLRPCRGPWHVDETYVRVDGAWRYLYRAALERLRERGFREDAGEGDPMRVLALPRSVVGYPQLYVLDPDGHIIEINAEQLDG